jgi:hypothetical protein
VNYKQNSRNFKGVFLVMPETSANQDRQLDVITIACVIGWGMFLFAFGFIIGRFL